MELAYELGHQDGFSNGNAAGQDTRQRMYQESTQHMARWQKDRVDLMPVVPGYTYLNRVDDPEWEKAKALIIKHLTRPAAQP